MRPGWRTLILHAGFPLLLGAAVYLAWRPATLPLFTVVDLLGLSAAVGWLRLTAAPLADGLPSWLLYSAPASCWAYSFCAVITATWRDADGAWRVAPPLLALAAVAAGELAQSIAGVPGVFDVRDLVSDTAAGGLAIGIIGGGGGAK